ncbi:MAG TPA: DUF2231 domain-containing protein [Vicinamibacterales bacterium]|jgi:nitrite reductase/ring-hydroxylating ferredoxin subunit/uncharacterized membrane protein|nr:DUF2231 domain-containing protein [Vicinamibacterales bacterium]
MKSRASIKSHPLHPMLIVYPFAFLTGAFGFSAAAAASKKRELRDVAGYLIPAGIVAGLVAAVPGIIDYLAVVPPHSSGKTRARKHALLNTTGLGLFTASWLLERNGRRPTASFLLQGLGSAVMSVAGFLGGTLVYRNQIAIDHRYANAGRWQEEERAHAGSRALTSAAAPLGVNQMKLVHVDEARIVVARTEDGYAAFQDRCTHRGGPLSDGALICGTVQCPWHGSQFDVQTGEVKCGPAEEKIKTYEIENAHHVRQA